MIGREADLLNLRTILADALEGNPRGVVVGGEAGIGKTRLLQEFIVEAAQSARVATGQCVDLGDAGPPFAPVTAVLRALAAELGGDRLVAAAGPGGAALRVLLPELGPTEEGGHLNRLHEAVTTALEANSRQVPLVVVIEDVQ